MANRCWFYFIAFLLFISTNSFGQKTLKSGFYGDNLEIVVLGEKVLIQFEYYDKWNQEIGFFENVCKFFCYGKDKSNDTIFLKVGMPGEISKGKLVLHGKDSITLYHNYNCGYSVNNFEEVGYSARLRSKREKIVSLGVVKDKKCYFYNQPEESAVTKSYIVKDDFVAILEQRNDWVLISYNSPASDKKFTKWIKRSALFDSDPQSW